MLTLKTERYKIIIQASLSCRKSTKFQRTQNYYNIRKLVTN